MTPSYFDALVSRFDPEGFDAPGGKARVRLRSGEEAWDVAINRGRVKLEPPAAGRADTLIAADPKTWKALAKDPASGLGAFGAGRLSMRGNLHIGTGFLSSTSDAPAERRLRFARAESSAGEIAYMEAGKGRGKPVLLIHGLGGTKASFLPTAVALGGAGYRAIALDMPGFGDSHKPILAPYDARFFADSIVSFMDELGIGSAHLVGNSLGGRVTLELALEHTRRVRRIALLATSLAWHRKPAWARYLKLARPELGLLQPAPRRVVEEIARRAVPGSRGGWTAAGVDEFLRSFLQPRGRAAFYAAARNILLEDAPPFWERLQGLDREALFVWGRHDGLVPLSFSGHVRKAVPAAQHTILNCGHVPQIELPRQTEHALTRFLGASGVQRKAA